MACLSRRQAQSRQELRLQLENEGLREDVVHLRHLLDRVQHAWACIPSYARKEGILPKRALSTLPNLRMDYSFSGHHACMLASMRAMRHAVSMSTDDMRYL